MRPRGADRSRKRPAAAVAGAVLPFLLLQVDGAIGARPQGTAAVGVVLRDAQGVVLRWHTARVPARTCNEAEYQALIAGLQFAQHHAPHAHICCVSDSQVVVDQMCGRATVRAGALQPLHAHAVALVRQCHAVTFLLIPRELNRLADALAWEALSGQRSLGAVAQAWLHDRAATRNDHHSS